MDQRSEQRRSLRVEVKRPGRAQVLGWTRDVSSGGVQVACREPVRRGSAVRLGLSFPGLVEEFQVRGRVVWSGFVDDGGQLGCGVRVWGNSSRQRLSTLLDRASQARRASSPYRIAIVDSFAFHHPVYRSVTDALTDGLDLEVNVYSRISCALELRDRTDTDMLVADASQYDDTGRHVLTTIMQADPRPIVVATGDSRRAIEKARGLGCEAALLKPIALVRWVETLACFASGS